MPTIQIGYRDLCQLTGKEYEPEELYDLLPDMKCEIEEWEGDIITVEVTPDRPDLFSTEGVARALLASGGELQEYFTQESQHTLDVETVDARPYIACAEIQNLQLTTPIIKSLMQLQETLHATFGRQRETMAIGLHDASALRWPLTYTAVEPANATMQPLEMDETLALSDIVAKHQKGKDYGHLVKQYSNYPVIIDADNHIVSFPPIINSAQTEVTLNTTDICIDVTGTDSTSVHTALNILVTACADRGGTIRQVTCHSLDGHYMTPDLSRVTIPTNISYINSILGTHLTAQHIQTALRQMNYTSQNTNNIINASPPPYRSDILHPIDVIEDCVMAYGLNTFACTVPHIATLGKEAPIEQFSTTIRDIWSGFGYQEISTPLLSNAKELYNNMNRPKSNILRISNPVSDTYTHLRDMLLPQLLSFLSQNTHVTYPQKVYECADIVTHRTQAAEKSLTKRHVAGCYIAHQGDVNTVKGELQGFYTALGRQPQFVTKNTPYYIDGRGAELKIKDTIIGEFGEIHPQVLQRYGLTLPCIGFELDIHTLQTLLQS